VQVVLQIDADMSKCDHRNGRYEIDDKDIAEGLLARLEWDHLDLNKTMSPTEAWGNDHHVSEA
jgi:hypothetical protein